MPWSEADRAKYDVVRERYSSDLSDAEYALIFPLLPAPKRRGRKPTCAREVLRGVGCLVLFDPLGVSVAISAQGLSPVHDGAEPVLRLARQRIVDPNRLCAGDERARGGGPRGCADGGRRRQPIGQDDGGWR